MSQTYFFETEDLAKLGYFIDALKCEESGHIMEAILLYDEGIHKLKQLSCLEPHKKELCSKYLCMYEPRTKQLRDQVKEHLNNSKLLERITLKKDARGRSYQRLLGVYLNDGIGEVHLNEPHLSEQHEFKNLVNFLEVLIKNCRFLKYIRLTTRPDTKAPLQQSQILKKIRDDLATGNIHMHFMLDETLHDRKIVLNSGVIIKIGHGLHYFKPIEQQHTLGECDYDFRKCLATEVEVWKCRAFVKPKAKDHTECTKKDALLLKDVDIKNISSSD